MPKTSLGRRRPRNRQRLPGSAIKVPLIPLQEQVQPLIPLQVSSSRAKLQHELSHAKPTPPHQTGAIPPAPTKMAERSLQKRQVKVTSTVTDANVVVIDGSGHTIVVTSITDVPTGPLPITLPWTTVTVEPLASITGVLTMAPIGASSATAPFVASSSLSASGISTQSPSSQATSISLPPTTISTLVEPSQSGNNQLGQPMTTANSNSSSISTSTSTSTSLTSSPTTLATISASALVTDTSSSSSSSTSSSTFTSESSITATISPTTAAPSITSGTPAATTAAAASAGGTTVNVPVVAGVVGGLAGLAVVLGLLLLLFRWLRKRQSGSTMLRSIDDEGTAPGTSHSNAPMTQNFASGSAGAGTGAGAVAAGAAGGAGIGAMIKRMTGGSTATTDTAPSERGFQNLGGRKLESVLLSGGDGFGEPATSGDQSNSFSRGWAERFPYETPSRHSSMIVGPATPFRRPSSSVAELSASRPDSETIRTMNSPPRNTTAGADWPLTNTSAGRPVRAPEMSDRSSPRQPFRGVPSLDPLGRTRYSQDGSRNSRFTEGL